MTDLEKLLNKWESIQPLSERKSYLLSQRFSVDYNFNSNHIEGNTLTYGQTELLLLFGKVSGEGNLKDFNDMKASQIGMVMMTEEAHLKDKPLTQNFIRQLHKTLLREDYKVYRTLPGDVTTSYTVHAGQYKTRHNSVITRYGDRFEYASPEETPALMTTLVDWYNDAEKSGDYSPIELAAIFHYRYIRIHPFEDGNGRIARLLVNYILARHNWPMIVVRNRNKKEYLEALHQSDIEVGPTPSLGAAATLVQIRHFVRFFKELMVEELKYNIEFAAETSDKVWWYDGKRIPFRSQTTPVILNELIKNSNVSIEKLADLTSISTTAVKKQLQKLKELSYIEKNEKDGSWRVFASKSV